MRKLSSLIASIAMSATALLSLGAGVAHAHVDDVKVTSPVGQVVAPLHDAASSGPSHATVVPSHCATAAPCHTLFLVDSPTGSFEPKSATVVPVPLHYSAPPAPVFGLFRPPRRG